MITTLDEIKKDSIMNIISGTINNERTEITIINNKKEYVINTAELKKEDINWFREICENPKFDDIFSINLIRFIYK